MYEKHGLDFRKSHRNFWYLNLKGGFCNTAIKGPVGTCDCNVEGSVYELTHTVGCRRDVFAF